MFDLDGLANDIRFTARVLRRRAGFTTTAITTLALAIGANTLLFSVVDRALLRPLPYANSNELVVVSHRDAKRARNDKAAGAEVVDWRTRPNLFSDVGFSWDAQYTLSSADHPITVRAFQLSTNFFSMLGVAPAIGRTFVRGDDVPGADHIVVLSDHLWKSEFGASRDIVGKTIRLDDAPFVVVGVMPARFAHPDPNVDLWTPLAIPPGLVNNRSLHAFSVVARLARGVTPAVAQKALGPSASIESLRNVYVGSARYALWTLEAAAILLLIIASANVANLALAHATVVQREVAIRRALGASAWRVARQFVTLGLVIAGAAFGIGALAASYGAQALPFLFGRLFASVPADLGDGLSATSIVAAALVTLVLGLMLGAIVTSGSRASEISAVGSRVRASAQGGTLRVRGAIIAAQFAISLVLLASSGLLIRSFIKLGQRSLGFGIENRLTILVQPPQNKYSAPGRTSEYLSEILANIRAIPGVRSAAATSAIPLSGMDARRRLVIGAVPDSAGEGVVHYRVVSPSYFSTMGIPLRRGRAFSDQDRAGGVDVALINETAARLRFGNEDPIGKVVTIAGGPAPMTAQIIGIVGDVRHEGLAAEPQAELYRPIAQTSWPFFGVVVRATDDATQLTSAVENAVWSVDRTQPIDRITSMASLASESLALRRTSMVLLSIFAAAAALLAAIGIYGVVAYVVAQRTREIGIRVALGASRSAVMGRIVASGARLAIVGAVLGIMLSYAVTRYLTSLLFGVQPMDAPTLAAAVAVTIGIAVAASYLPARRAARIDPAVTLREE